MQRYLLGDSRYSREVLENALHSDVVLFAAGPSKEAFGRFLDACGRADLDARVRVAPLYPVAEMFYTLPVRTARADRVVAIGRWDDPQKDARLLATAVERYVRRGQRTEFVLVGRGGERWFSGLERRFAQVRYAGVLPHGEVANLMGGSRAVLFSSRWEGFPHTANEALALGCTVVGTPLPSLRGVCAGGRFGRVARSRRPADLADALEAELRTWEAGGRDPVGIAAFWRAQLRPEIVCARLLDEVSSRVFQAEEASA